VLVLATGCATRPDLPMMQAAESLQDMRQIQLLAVTTRARQSPGTNVFTRARSATPNHAVFTVAIPRDHRPGRIESIGRTGSAMAVTSQGIVTSRAALLDLVAADAGPARDVSIFVHGYNLNFGESLLRLAQLSADGVLHGTPVLFSWPSEARLQGYLYDRDSATVSRDALAVLLADLAGDPRIGNIEVLAHSLGGWLAVEALRQLRLAGREDVLDRLDIVLAAPDIDMDVFAAQMAIVGPLRVPMKVLVAPDDRALILSGRLSGEVPRLGTLKVTDPRAARLARAYNIAVLDISQARASDRLGHDRYAWLGVSAGSAGSLRDLRRAGAFAVNAVGEIVAAPFGALGAALATD